MKNDLKLIGLNAGTRQYRVAASATRAEVGEPIHFIPTYTSGASDVNTVVLAVADSPVIGTHAFVGINAKRFSVNAAGTVTAQTGLVAVPIPNVTLIRGNVETDANIDTDSELLGVFLDVTVIDYNATGAADGGELYTIKAPGTADTGGLTIVDGSSSRGTVDCTLDPRAVRFDIS